MKNNHKVICRLPSSSSAAPSWASFTDPLEVISANNAESVLVALSNVETLVRQGKYAAGFISYEAAPAFDEAFAVNSPTDDDTLPLISFGIYDAPSEIIKSFASDAWQDRITLTPDVDAADYIEKVRRIKEYIYDGDIYQANFTFRSKSANIASPYLLFAHLMQQHPVPYGAYVDIGTSQIISLSPELFLEKNGLELLSVPMKGTAARMADTYDDKQAVANLAADSKNRAENLMIVDMVRNDMGRIAETGSVKVDKMFHVDTYSTLHQMITEVRCGVNSTLSLIDIFRSLFPAASITGAPKIRAMQIIQELENSPRRVYTGSIGCITPEMDFSFNVAIRTLICCENSVELGIGSGIVADSVPEDEWKECLLKSTFVNS